MLVIRYEDIVQDNIAAATQIYRYVNICVWQNEQPTLTQVMTALRYIFFPRVILYNCFLLLLIYGGLGFWGLGLISGFWGWGFQLMGFGACGVGPSGFFGFGLSI